MTEWPLSVWLVIIVFAVVAVAEMIRKDRVRRAEHILAKQILADDRARKARGKVS